jgi:hypothetical protein
LSSTEVTRKALRKFGLVFTVITVLVALVSLWRGRESLVMPFFAVSGAFFVISLVYPVLLGPLYRGMLKLSGYMGWVNTRVLLIIVYYLVFTPVALVFKLIGKDPLERKLDREAPTYWKRRDRVSTDVSTGATVDNRSGEQAGEPGREDTGHRKERAYHYEKQF